MIEQTASVHWEGPDKDGKGQISTETGALERFPYGFASRFECERRGTNPEEILAAAHAACFTMAFSFACDEAGFATGKVDTQARVRLTKEGEVPEAPLAAADRVLGDAHAKLTLVEYGDCECPACMQAEPLVQHLVDTHRGRLRFVFWHFPLVEIHPNAERAAEAAAQGQFWPMHHLLFAQAHQLTPAALTGHALSLGLAMNRFNAEMTDHIYTQRISGNPTAGLRGSAAREGFQGLWMWHGAKGKPVDNARKDAFRLGRPRPTDSALHAKAGSSASGAVSHRCFAVVLPCSGCNREGKMAFEKSILRSPVGRSMRGSAPTGCLIEPNLNVER